MLLLFAIPAWGQDLPKKPEPTINTEFKIEAVVMGAAWLADTVSTHDWIRACPTCVETGGLFNGSRSTPKIMGAWAAVDIGSGVLAYEWKKHVHNKYLHPLWRIPMIIRTEGHTSAAIGNWRQQ
jgi:hypothetical protein